MSATARETTFVDPRCLYTRRGTTAVSGVSDTRIREARQKYGLTIPWLTCGKRKFARGADIIKFIELLSEIEQRQGAE